MWGVDSLTLTADTPAPLARLCAFIDAKTGANCNQIKLFSRGYCARHYKALARAGAFKSDPKVQPSNVPTTAANLSANVRRVVRAFRKLEQNASDFARDWIVGSKVAATKGNTEPAQQALIALGVIKNPKADTSPINGKGHIIVNVGVKLAGLKQQDDDGS